MSSSLPRSPVSVCRMVPNPNPFHPLDGCDSSGSEIPEAGAVPGRCKTPMIHWICRSEKRSHFQRKYSSRASPVAVQLRAVAFHPGLGLVGARKKRAREAPEFVRVVELAQMRDLMCGEIVEDERRRENEPPRERQGAVRRARSPAAFRVLDGDASHLRPRRRRVASDRDLEITPRLALQELGDAPRHMLGRARHLE